FVVAGQRFHPFAVDWLHPDPWPGTVAAGKAFVRSFCAMRDSRLVAPVAPGPGWHVSWVCSHSQQVNKLAAFAHSEVERWAGPSIQNADCYRHGYHVDGQRLDPVDVDESWPRWIRDRSCPESWFRPRRVERSEVRMNAV